MSARAYVTLHNDRSARVTAAFAPAIKRALNRAIATVETDVARKLAAELGLRQKTIKERLFVQPASVGRLEAKLTVGRKPIPLIEFPGIRKEPTGISRTGFRTIRHAFRATLQSGHRGVFLREGPSRPRAGLPRSSPGLPIRELTGPGLPKVAVERHILESGQAVGEAAFSKNLTHELGRAVRGEG